MIKHDVVIVGSGLAGMRAALEVCKDMDVAILSKAIQRKRNLRAHRRSFPNIHMTL